MSRPALLLRRAAGGVSLVEALVALAVMSIGMLSLVGVQTTMRLNSDIAKQRTEATRIASDELERLRSFASRAPVPGQPGVSYDEIQDRVVDPYVPPGSIGNTSYRVEREITEARDTAQKLVTVKVTWTDRTGVGQTVSLESSISAATPMLSALLRVPHRESALTRSRGRHVSIPQLATDLGDGHSRFAPPGAALGVFWYFNNLTGEMRACPLGAVDYLRCPRASFVSGSVRYHIAPAQPTAADAESPAGPVFALRAAPNAMALADPVGTGIGLSCFSTVVGLVANYVCAVTTADTAGWGGQLNPVPVDGSGTALLIGAAAGQYRICRYTSDVPNPENSLSKPAIELDAYAQYTFNADHPRKYCLERPRTDEEQALREPCTGSRVKTNLINQNFLVIQGPQRCPTELNPDGNFAGPANGGGVDPLVLANTRAHKPFP